MLEHYGWIYVVAGLLMAMLVAWALPFAARPPNDQPLTRTES